MDLLPCDLTASHLCQLFIDLLHTQTSRQIFCSNPGALTTFLDDFLRGDPIKLWVPIFQLSTNQIVSHHICYIDRKVCILENQKYVKGMYL